MVGAGDPDDANDDNALDLLVVFLVFDNSVAVAGCCSQHQIRIFYGSLFLKLANEYFYGDIAAGQN